MNTDKQDAFFPLIAVLVGIVVLVFFMLALSGSPWFLYYMIWMLTVVVSVAVLHVFRKVNGL